ncbi:MAG: aconitate hydratase 2/2-methylisocitrate dehydratase, partial [Paraglaciecola sp.]
MLEAYRKHVDERAVEGIPPKALNAEQVAGLVELLKAPPAGEGEFLLELLSERVPPGVDEAAYVKAGFLSAIVNDEATSVMISKDAAIQLLGNMHGGYNIVTLVEALENNDLAELAAEELKHTLLMFDAFHDVEEKARAGNAFAQDVLESWADAEWFTARPDMPEKVTYSVFKVTSESNTDDISPAPDAWSRPDIPLHAKAMYKMTRDGLTPQKHGEIGPLAQIEEIKAKGHPVAFVGDVVGTGSSRKSATNSVLWFFGEDLPGVPNKRGGGICIGGNVAPIFFNTMEDAGALVFEANVDKLNMGDVIDIFPLAGKIQNAETGELLSEFSYKSDVLLDEVRAGGRINLIIGRGLTDKARESLNLGPSDLFRMPVQ